MTVSYADMFEIPYKHHGRDATGMDCYGLVIEFEKRLGRVVFDFDYMFKDYKSESDCDIWQQSMEKWERTNEVQFGDVILFYDEKKRIVHAAVCVEKNKILHCDVKGVKVERLDTFYYQNWRAYKWRQ